MNYADAHCHLSDLRFKNQIEEILSQCSSRRIDLFLQGGINPDEWLQQLELSKKYAVIRPVFGLHPMWVAQQTEEIVNEALAKLAQLMSQAVGIGEVGLDLRPQYADSLDLQMEALQNQVELSEFTKLPIVWHLVRCFDFIKNNPFVSDWFGAGGFVHSFNGHWEAAQFYLNHGLMISVGGALTYPKNKKLQEVVKKIPLEFLLLETDSPDQKNFNDTGDLNYPHQIWQTAQVVGELRGITADEVLGKSTENLKRRFKI